MNIEFKYCLPYFFILTNLTFGSVKDLFTQNTVSGNVSSIPTKQGVKSLVTVTDNYDPSNTHSVWSDTLGNFSINNLVSSEYTVNFKSNNRFADSKIITIEDNTTINNELYDSLNLNSTIDGNNIQMFELLTMTFEGAPQRKLWRSDSLNLKVWIDTTYLSLNDLDTFMLSENNIDGRTDYNFSNTVDTSQMSSSNIRFRPVYNDQMPPGGSGKNGYTQVYRYGPNDGRIKYVDIWLNLSYGGHLERRTNSREICRALGFVANSSNTDNILGMNGIGYTGDGFPTDDECVIINMQANTPNGKDMTYVELHPSVVGVKDHNPVVRPKSVVLYQNYPNPFNPNTTIGFVIQKQSFVSLKIFNSIGQLVEVLINKNLSAGGYKITWNSSGYSSGTYFYTLQAGSFQKTNKILLIK